MTASSPQTPGPHRYMGSQRLAATGRGPVAADAAGEPQGGDHAQGNRPGTPHLPHRLEGSDPHLGESLQPFWR